MRDRTFVSAAVAAAATLALAVAIPAAATTIAPSNRDQAQVGTDQALTDSAIPRSTDPMQAGDVVVDFQGDFFGWALLDRATGEIIGQDLTSTSSTESMIKTWLVADFLRRAEEGSRMPSAEELQLASDAIRNSDDGAAESLYLKSGGNESIERMIEICGLSDTTVHDGWWSRTEMSPRDAVTLADCIADGTAAGPQWTGWLLDEMRNVTGTTSAADQHATYGGGRWGIIDGVPEAVAADLAIKNGWTAIGADDNWHLNCLAISDDWAMAVMLRYPTGYGLDYGADVCAQVARQLIALT